MNHRMIALILTGGAVAAAATQLRVEPAVTKPAATEIVPASADGPYDVALPAWAKALADDQNAHIEGQYLDVEISSLSGLSQRGRIGSYPTGRLGLAGSTTSCNIGTVEVPWYRQMDPRHPFIAQNLYRVNSAGTLEQIGTSWLKHGFFAADSSGCGNCQGNLGDDHLNLGCQDTYGSGNNSDRNWLGPRYEVDPLSGVWDPCGSYFDIADGSQPDCRESPHTSGLGPTDHMLQVTEADLDVSGAQFYFESYYVILDEDNNLNNVSYRKTNVSRNGNSWSFSHPENMVRGMFVMNWGDYHHFVNDRSNGDAVIATRVVDLGGGNFRYEYAVYNHTLWQGVNSFNVAIAPGVNVSSITFHAPTSYDEPYGNETWTSSVGADAVSWSCDDYNTNEFANTLRYGTIYTYTFEANAAPTAGSAILGLHKPGDVDSITMGCVTPGMPNGVEPAGLKMEMTPLFRGQRGTWTVTGARPGERVYFAYSDAGLNSRIIGIGPTHLPGLNFDVEILTPGTIFGDARADSNGVATLRGRVPIDAPLENTAFQAVAPRSGGASVKSNVELRDIQN